MLAVDTRYYGIQEREFLFALYLNIKLGAGIHTVNEFEERVGILQGLKQAKGIVSVSPIMQWLWYRLFNQHVIFLQVCHPDVSVHTIFKLFQHYKYNKFIEDPEFNFEILRSLEMPRDCSLDKANEESSLSFQDDKSKNGSVESVDSSAASRLKDTVQLVGRTTEQTAPNLIKGRHCQACSKDVQIEKESIQCRLCKDIFHAINCVDNNDHWVSSVTSFTNHILPALNNRRNAKTGKKRPGAFCIFVIAVKLIMRHVQLPVKLTKLLFWSKRLTLSRIICGMK